MPRKKSTEIQEELLQTATEESKAGKKPRNVSANKKDASYQRIGRRRCNPLRKKQEAEKSPL